MRTLCIGGPLDGVKINMRRPEFEWTDGLNGDMRIVRYRAQTVVGDYTPGKTAGYKYFNFYVAEGMSMNEALQRLLDNYAKAQEETDGERRHERSG